MSATEDFLNSLKAKRSGQVSTVLSHDARQPDDVAEAMRLGEELSLPSVVVEADPQGFRRQAEQQRSARDLQDAPLTAKWLSDLQNGALAKDDVSNLSWFEKKVVQSEGALTRAAGRGIVRAGAIIPETAARVDAQRVSDFGKTAEDIYQEELQRLGPNALPEMRATARQTAQARFEAVQGMSDADRDAIVSSGAKSLAEARAVLDRVAEIPMNESGTRFRDETLAGAENTLAGTFKAFMDDPEGGISFLAQVAAESLPILAASAGATALTGSGGVGVATMATGSLLTENSNSAMEFLAEQGVDLSTPEAAMAVLEDADLMRAAAERGLSRGLVIALFDAASGGVAGKALAKSPLGDVVAQGLAQAALGSAGEGAAQAVSGQEINWQDIVIEGLAEFVTAPAEVMGVAGRRLGQRAEADGAGSTAQTIAEIDDMAAKSKLKQRAPQKFQEALEAQGDGDFYVPADDLREYFQAKDIDFDAEIMDAWGLDPDTFAAAEAAGRDIPVSKAVYAARISGTEDAEWFARNAVTNPNELSMSQAERFNAEWGDTMQAAFEEAERQRKNDEEVRASDVQVYDSVFSQLRAAGRTRDVADNEARVWSAFWRTMGERYGADPLDLARSMGVQIQGPQTPIAGRQRGDIDLMLNTLRSQGDKALRPKGHGVLEFIRDQGGISDRGGDIEALDVPKGVIAETRAEAEERASQPSFDGPVAARGKGLDEIGRALIEAGYFPEYQGGADILPDGTVIDEAAIALEAISEAVSGRDRFVEGEGPDADLSALAEQLQERGVDLSLSNDEIVAALQDTDGQEYDQNGRLITDTPEFKAWFGDSKVVDANGEPLVVYHGTASDFESFDASVDAKHIDMPGFYFTPEAAIADNFSASASRKEIRDAGGYIEGFEGANTVAVYLSIENPATIDGSEPDGRMASTSRIRSELDAAKSAGHDGAIIRGWADGSGDVQYVAFSPTQIKSVFNRGTFDPNDARILYQRARGSIVLPTGGLENGQTIINLFEGADLSTVLHESGHFFLEAFFALATSPDAPQAMRDDLAVIHKFLGVEMPKDGEAPTFVREQHETWARGFEAYLMEGKAPSLELADAFARFKSWLTRIYRTIKGLNVTLTPEVREVMDRMLATDDEIRAAREAQEMSPLFTSQAAAGMSDAAWKTYQRMARRSEEQASQVLLEKTMEKVRRQTEKWWKDERKQVMAQVAETVNSKREYRLIEMLANQTWIGSDGQVPDMQMDRAELVERFGEGVLAELSRKRLGGKRAIYANGGASLGEVADFFGFKTPAEMINSLQNAGKRRDVITTETDRVMLDRYGDPLADGSIEEEALAAIHSEQQASALAMEVRHLSERAGRTMRNITAKVFRQRAKMMLGRMSVKEATRPDAFLAAERKSARAAEDAFAKVARGRDAGNGLAMAAKHKEQQLLNHYLYLESRDLTQMVAKKREKMRAYTKSTVREKLEGGYIEQIDALLEQYDFRVRTPGQVQRSENLKAFVDRMVEDGREAELNIDQRLIDQANARHYTRLSVDELRGLFDTIDNIDHMGRFKQKLIEAGRKRDLAESVSKVVGQITANHKTRDPSKPYWGRRALNAFLRPDSILSLMDNGDELGISYNEIKRSIDEGQAREQAMGVEMVERMDALFAAHYSKKQLRAMQNPLTIDGETLREWTKAEIIALALNTGNESNFQRLMDQSVPAENRMSQERLNSLLAQLDGNDWRFIQGMWDEVNSLWPELAIVHRRRTGVEPKKIEAKLMVEAPVGVSGGYYPIEYDPHKGAKAEVESENAWESERKSRFGATAAIANGMTRQREATGGGRALSLDLSVPFSHMRDTVRYITLSEAIDASHRIIKHPDVVDAFRNAGMQDTRKTLDLWLRDIAVGPIFNTDIVNSPSRILKNNFTLMNLSLNFKTIFLQMTGMGQSAAAIGKRAMLRGVVQYARAPNAMIEDVVSRSAVMAERKTTMQKDMYDFINDTKVASPLNGPIRDAYAMYGKLSFYPITRIQFTTVDMPTWLGAYSDYLDKGKSEAEAAHYADRMVERAQDSGIFSFRSAIERGTLGENARQLEFIKLFTTLGGYMLTKNNRAIVNIAKTRRALGEATTVKHRVIISASAASDMLLLFAFEAMVMGALYAAMTDEEDEDDLREFVYKETGLAVIAGFPFVRDSQSALKGFGGGGVYGSIMEAPAKAAIQAYQGEFDIQFGKAAAQVLGLATGLPTTATIRAYEGIMDGTPAEALFGSNPLTR